MQRFFRAEVLTGVFDFEAGGGGDARMFGSEFSQACGARARKADLDGVFAAAAVVEGLAGVFGAAGAGSLAGVFAVAPGTGCLVGVFAAAPVAMARV